MPIRRNMYTGRRRLYESLPPILRPPASQSDTSHGITNIQAANAESVGATAFGHRRIYETLMARTSEY